MPEPALPVASQEAMQAAEAAPQSPLAKALLRWQERSGLTDTASYAAGWMDRGLWLNGALDTSARHLAPESPAGEVILDCEDCQNRTFWLARREGYITFVCTNCGSNYVDDEGFGRP